MTLLSEIYSYGINDSLLNIYQLYEPAKILWNSLKDKYMPEDSTFRKFLVSNFNPHKIWNLLCFKHYRQITKFIEGFYKCPC